MPPSPPTPPSHLSSELVDALDACSTARLRDIADYAETLAAYRDREDNEPASRDSQATDDRPEGVPTKATLTVKTINDNRYYYWQWRDGDSIKSKYKGPAGEDH